MDPYPNATGVSEEQLIDCRCPGECTGSLRLGFRGHSSRAIPFDSSAELVKYRLEVRLLDLEFIGSGDAVTSTLSGSFFFFSFFLYLFKCFL